MSESDTPATDNTTETSADSTAAKSARKRAARPRKTASSKESKSEPSKTEASASPAGSPAGGSPSEGESSAASAKTPARRSRSRGRSAAGQGATKETAPAARASREEKTDKDEPAARVSDAKPIESGTSESRTPRGERGDQKRGQQSGASRTRGRGRGREQDRQGSRPSGPRPSIDSEELKSKAWQVYLAELAEEGVTMYDRGNSQKLAEHAFLLAEIFLGVQERKVRPPAPRQSQPRDQREGGQEPEADASGESSGTKESAEDPTI